MNNFFRNNSKKLLAVFGVLLMIVFILPAGLKNGNDSGRVNRLVGHIGDQKIFSDDLLRAQSQWNTLEKYIVINNPNPQAGGQFISWVEMLAEDVPGRGPRSYWFQKLYREVKQHSEIYCLLQKEADNLGISADPAEVDAVFGDDLAIRVPNGNGAVVPLKDLEDPDVAAQMRDAMGSLLKVNMLMNRAENVVKVSEPRRRSVLAQTAQDLTVNYVEFSVDDYLPKLTPPTDEEKRAQFMKFSDFDAGQPSLNNPHGFGYKYPDRVTLQYIALPNDEVKKSIRSSKDEYTWTKDAYKVYFAHPAEFQTDPSTQPAPSTSSSTTRSLAASNPAASTKPTTKPFDSVRNEIIDALIYPELDKKQRDVQDRINARLANDFAIFQKSHPMAVGTTLPTTSPGETYASYKYLQQVAADIKKETGVLPTVGQVGQYSSAKALADVPMIGKATLGQTATFADYAITHAAALQRGGMPADAATLQLFQPSATLHDIDYSSYVFRLTGVKPAAPPQSMEEVADAVTRDVRLVRAYDLANADAIKLIAAANGSSATSQPATMATTGPATVAATMPSTQPTTAPIDSTRFMAAAASMGKSLMKTSPFGLQGSGPIEPLKLDTLGAATFRGESLKLLQTAATQPSTTVVLIDLPVQQRLYAAQLSSVETTWPPGQQLRAEVSRSRLVTETINRDIRMRWLDYDAVVKRVNWKDERIRKES